MTWASAVVAHAAASAMAANALVLSMFVLPTHQRKFIMPRGAALRGALHEWTLRPQKSVQPANPASDALAIPTSLQSAMQPWIYVRLLEVFSTEYAHSETFSL